MIALPSAARLARAFKFAMVGVTGLVVNLAVQFALAERLGLNYLVAAVIATQVSSTANFVMADVWVFDGTQSSTGRGRRFMAFVGMNNFALVLRAPMMWALSSQVGLHYSLSNLLSLAVMTLVRFGVADKLIWKPTSAAGGDAPMWSAARFTEALSQLDILLDSLGVPHTALATDGPAGAGDWKADWLGDWHGDWWTDESAAAPLARSAVGLAPAPTGTPDTSGTPDTPGEADTPDALDDPREPENPELVDPLWLTPTVGKRSSWLTRITLLLIAGVAVVYRLFHLSAVGLNSDEAVYAGQGAAMFHVGNADQFFSLFRAHPLLLQAVVGATFRFAGQSDFAARAVVALVFGVGSVLLTYALGKLLSGPGVGLIAAAICAVLPYHVIISRQVLVDTAMGCFAVLSLYCIIRTFGSRSQIPIVLAFASAGAAAISKEIAILIVPILFYALWRRGGWRSLYSPAVRWSCAVYAWIVLPFPATRLISQSKNASAFFLWQFTREPNHGREWFGRVLLQYVTAPVIILLVVGVVLALRSRRSVDRVVVAYVGFFLVFFTAWPTKLFPYLFLLAPPICVLAAQAIAASKRLFESRPNVVRIAGRGLTAAVLIGVLGLLGALSWRAVETTAAKDIPGLADFDVEVQSFAGTREFAEWAQSTPTNARFLTIGPSLGNILRFYGERDSVAMSVSVDPLKRNPAYVPIPNPDLALREMQVQYVVWDSYSADRSSFYSARTLLYARKFGGIIVFSAYEDADGDLRTVAGPAPDGIRARLVVYSMAGGPLPTETDAGEVTG